MDRKCKGEIRPRAQTRRRIKFSSSEIEHYRSALDIRHDPFPTARDLAPASRARGDGLRIHVEQIKIDRHGARLCRYPNRRRLAAARHALLP